MRVHSRILILALLLGATVLSGCSGANTVKQLAGTAEKLATQLPQAVETNLAATATPAPSEVPTEAAPAPGETPEPSTPEVSASGWQTITQQVGVTQSDSGTFTITESINLGTSEGIEWTSESVPMPTSATPYDAARLPKIGDAVQHPNGLIVQVTGVRTVEIDDENELILVDVVVGNGSKERQLIATDPLMEIVSGDGHWYSAYWYAFYWARGGEAYMKEKAAEFLRNMKDHGVATYFSAPLEPGEAAAGTAAFPVPKSATELAFGFQPWEQAIWLMFLNEYSPTMFFPLGIRGDFPALPADADTVEAGKTYQVGDSFRAPERGVGLEVYSAWRQPDELNSMTPKQEGEEYVVVSLMAPLKDGAKPLDTRELSLVGGNGERYELQEYATDFLTNKLGRYNQRGVLVFKGPADAQGLTLKFDPIDPATLESSPVLLEDEAATVELGELGEAPVVPPPAPAAEPGEAPEPTATAQPTGNAQMGDRVVLGKLAVTLNGWQTDAGPEGFQVEGKTWLMVDVTVENVSTEDVPMYPDEFSFVDQAGVIYDSLLNKPSAWPEAQDYVLEYATLAPSGKIENKWLVIQVPDSALSGLQMRHAKDDGSVVLWDLGL